MPRVLQVDAQQYPPVYQYARWTLIVLLAIEFILIIVAGVLFTKFIKDIEGQMPTTKEGAKVAIAVAWVIVGFQLVTCAMGALGAWRNHYCMTMAYAISMSVLLLINIFNIS